MKYINQNEYPHIPYRTIARVEGLTDEQRTTVLSRAKNLRRIKADSSSRLSFFIAKNLVNHDWDTVFFEPC